MKKVDKEALAKMTPEDQRAYRETLVKLEWSRYQLTKDRRHLANICRDMPFFGNDQVGEEIAKLLTLDNALTPITKKPKMRKLQDDTAIKSMWKAWKDTTWDEDGSKVPESLIMPKIGKEIGIEGEDDKTIYESVRQRLKKLGLMKL